MVEGADSPTRTPFILTRLMRVIPAANSGASSRLSAASTASLRTFVIRTLIEIDPSPRASSDTRNALAFERPGRNPLGRIKWKNSSSLRLYTRLVTGGAVRNWRV